MCPPLGEQAYQLVEARNFACSAVVDSVIYVFGGREQPGSWPTPPATLATSQNIALKFLFIFLPIAFITFYNYRYVIMLDKPLSGEDLPAVYLFLNLLLDQMLLM
jgi:hypothetical protein